MAALPALRGLRSAGYIARLPVVGACCCLLFLQLAAARWCWYAAGRYSSTAACPTSVSVLLVECCKSAAAAASVYFRTYNPNFEHIMFVSHYAHAGKLSFFTIFPTEILDRQIYHDV